MSRSKSYALAGTTVFSGLAIGYLMQFGLALPTLTPATPAQPLQVSEITDTASPLIAPQDWRAADGVEADLVAEVPGIDLLRLVAAEGDIGSLDDAARGPVSDIDPGAGQTSSDNTVGVADDTAVASDCRPNLTATAAPAALVELTVSAPCHARESFTLHHSGLMITASADEAGTAALTIPALTESALFIISFDDGEGAVASVRVPDIDAYHRIALQWSGHGGLELHAREFGADYFSAGHVWHDTPRSPSAARDARGGFLDRLGTADQDRARVAEIYSLPVSAERGGEVAVSVEAEILASNCAQDVDAQVLTRRPQARLKVQDLTIAMPDCDATGDFLVLQNVIGDLKIAAN